MLMFKLLWDAVGARFAGFPVVKVMAGTIAARFGVGPVTVDSSWTELVIDVPRGRSSSAIVAELYEQLAERNVEARAVTATSNEVLCVVRPEAGDELRRSMTLRETKRRARS